MVAPVHVTPDTSGSARRPDDHSGPDTPASLNSAANVFGLARYGHFCSVASELIIESMDTLSDRSSSAAQKKAAVSNMRLLATKLAEVDSAMVSAAASSNRSIHSVKKAVEKLRNEEGREVVGDPSPRSRKKQKSDSLAKVELFVVSPDAAMKDIAGTLAAPASSSSPIPARRTSPRTSLIPAPTAASGIFSPREVVSILRSLPDEKSRTKAKQLMRKNEWVQYRDKKTNKMVVHGKRALNSFWAIWKESIAPPPKLWGKQGGPVYMKVADLVEQVRAGLQVDEDGSVNRDDVDDLIVSAREKRLKDHGVDVRGLDLHPSAETLRTYYSALMAAGNFKIVGSVRELPSHRAVAMNSKRNKMSNCVVAAAAQSIKVDVVPADRELQEGASEGAKKLLQLVKDAEGSPNVVPVRPELLTSRDTVSFQAQSNATANDGGEVHITLPQYTGKTHSVHSSGDSSSEQFRGITVHAETLITGAGQIAPILLSITKVKAAELPADKCPGGFLFVPVDGMAPGSDRDVYSAGTGHVAFIRDGEKIDVDLFKEHWIQIQAPFLKALRKKAAPGASEDGQQVDPLNRSANWHDGGMAGLFAAASEELLLGMAQREELDVKHPFGTSLIFQPCDLASAHRTLKALVSNMGTLSDSGTKSKRKRKRSGSAASGAGGKEAAAAFKLALQVAKREHGLNLSANREKSLSTLVGKCSYLLGQAFTSPVIVQSFVEAGLLDAGAKQYPDMFRMLNNKKSPLDADLINEYFIAHFSEMYLEVKRTGEVSEATFDRLDSLTGFDTKDRDEKGNVVERTATIANEWRQRAKIVSHEEQRRLRREEDEAASHQAAIDHAKERDDRKGVRDLALMAELKLTSALELGDGWKNESNDVIASALEMKDPNNASKNYFSAGEVEALVKVRRWKSCRATRSRPKIATRKGDATKAKECLRLRPGGAGATPLGQNFCTIYQVLIYRNDPWILDELPEEAPAAPSGRRGNTERRHPVIVNAAESVEKLPSDFLDDDGFVEAIEKGDLIGSDFSATSVSAEMRANGDDLHRLLKDRLKWRKDKRLDPNKHSHWSIRSFERNLGALAAIDVKGSRVIDDVKSADRETCFLRDPIDGKFLEVKEGEASGVHGNYNRFDERRRRFIRTGFEYDEESSRDVVARVSEHVEAANLRRDCDKKKPHYRKYPHKDAAHLVPDIERDGYADDLKSYVGIGFKNTATSTITDADDGMFDWDEETVKGLQASNDGCSTLESKKRKLVAYWFELLDDLKIPMKHSVSESFGIEAYLRIFG